MTDMLVLNKFQREGKNEVLWLDTLSKTEILKELKQITRSPSNSALAIASDLQDDDTPASELVTLSEWLEDRKISLEKPDLHRLANIVSREFRTETGGSPRTISRPDSKGRWLIKANGFRQDQLYILEASLEKLRAKTIRKEGE